MGLHRTTTLLLAGVLVAAPSLAGGLIGTIALDPNRAQGSGPNGNPLLFTPDPVQLGSSVSHWDSRAVPNLLMEPAINPDLPFLELDLTDDLMKDLGWELTVETPGGMGATFRIFAFDDGFADPRPFPGAPGNPATTLGEARVNLFIAVLTRWAETLESSVPIDVIVLWPEQFCNPSQGAVLAAASTTFIFADDSLPFPDTWYHASLAEALVGFDATGPVEEGGGDLIVFVNSLIDDECLGEGTGYYYGLDGNQPPNQIDLAPTILHEVAHGAGFANFTNEETGETPQDLPSIYDRFSHDVDQGKTWAEMNDEERRQSAVNFGRLEWIGASASMAAAELLEPPTPVLEIPGPPEVAGTYDIGLATFGPPIPDEGLTGEIVCQIDQGRTDGTPFDGCTAPTNSGELTGAIALIDRGNCNFTQKVANAQAAGAIGAIIANNAGNTPLGLGGSDPTITIPAVSVGRTTGAALREAACGDDVALVGSGGRFQVSAVWRTEDAEALAGTYEFTDDTALLWFFDDANIELVVKVLDGCDNNERFWVFAGGLTNVEVELNVVDTTTGLRRTYLNAFENPFQPIQDTDAFATCP